MEVMEVKESDKTDHLKNIKLDEKRYKYEKRLHLFKKPKFWRTTEGPYTSMPSGRSTASAITSVRDGVDVFGEGNYYGFRIIVNVARANRNIAKKVC